jgi:transposase
VAQGLAGRRCRRVDAQGRTRPDPTLSDTQLAELKTRLERGPAAAGYGEDQRWTLARIRTLIGSMFKVRVSITLAWEAMQRIGHSSQLPTTRAIERDEPAIVSGAAINGPR